MPSGPSYVALLRAVNVGGRSVSMADLRAEAERMGLEDARTLLASGNLVFRAPGRSAAELERRLEERIRRRFRLDTDVLVRDGPGIDVILRSNPFPEFAANDPSHLHVVFLREAPSDQRAVPFSGELPGPEQLRVVGAHAYVTYPEGSGRSKLTLTRIEAGLGTRGTARNWNTVGKLAALLGEPPRPPTKGGGG